MFWGCWFWSNERNLTHFDQAECCNCNGTQCQDSPHWTIQPSLTCRRLDLCSDHDDDLSSITRQLWGSRLYGLQHSWTEWKLSNPKWTSMPPFWIHLELCLSKGNYIIYTWSLVVLLVPTSSGSLWRLTPCLCQLHCQTWRCHWKFWVWKFARIAKVLRHDKLCWWFMMMMKIMMLLLMMMINNLKI